MGKPVENVWLREELNIADAMALANHRNQLLLVDLADEQPQATTLDASAFGRLDAMSWAPDGRWLPATLLKTLPQIASNRFYFLYSMC